VTGITAAIPSTGDHQNVQILSRQETRKVQSGAAFRFQMPLATKMTNAMISRQEVALQELTSVMDRFAGAMMLLVMAYAHQRNAERDAHWLTLQMTKEFGAMVAYTRRIVETTRTMEALKTIRKACQDCYEEAEHYVGYRKILDWYEDGKAYEVPEMWGYGDYGDFAPGPAMKQSLWPEHYGYVEMAKRLSEETASPWVRDVIYANREGAAVAFHHAMSQLPQIDEFARRVVAHEREVARDELYHGPQLLRELARAVPSEAELQEAVAKITELRLQELRQRNEQLQHPLGPTAMATLERDFREKRGDRIPIFSMIPRS
jgi:hypothetical protein